MAKPGRNEIAVGVLLLAAMALLGWMALKVGALRRVAEEVEVSARFADVTGLPEGAAVQVAGVPVGRVAALRVDGKKALVTLALREDAALRKDVVARIRARSVLGEKYVELSPQGETEALLKDGDELAVGVEPVEIDQLVTSMGPMLAAVDPEAIASLVGALNDAVKQDPERLNRILADTETLLHNAAVASEQAPALMDEARAALGEVRRATSDARPVIARADRVLGQLEEVSSDLPKTTAELNALLSDGRGAVADGRAMLSKMDGSVDQLQVVLDNLSEIDKWELRRLLREEGIVVRLRESQVVETPP